MSDVDDNLYELIYSCLRGQRVSIFGGLEDQDALRDGLYVEQEEDEHVQEFFENADQNDGRLLILTGSAGDGKSALLGRAYSEFEGIPADRINMDATEARRSDEDYRERLTDFFNLIIEDISSENGHRSAIAMNYGLAINYFESEPYPDRFQPIWDTLQAGTSSLFHYSDDSNISVINLSHRTTYSTNPDSFGEGMVLDVLNKFNTSNEESPFYEAYQRDQEECPAGSDCLLQHNIRVLKDPNVREKFSKLLAGWSVASAAYLDPRSIINFIASAILPIPLQELPDHDICPVGYSMENGEISKSNPSVLIWNSIYEQIGAETKHGPSELDPISHTTFDEDYSMLGLASNPSELAEAMDNIPITESLNTLDKIKTYHRSQYLRGIEGETILDEEEGPFEEYISALTQFSRDDFLDDLKNPTQAFLDEIKEALSNWSGQQRDDELVEFVDAYRPTKFTFLSHFEDPDIDINETRSATQKIAVPGRIGLVASEPGNSESKDDGWIHIPVSFEIYRLMTQVSRGYTPNARDLNRSHAIQLLNSRLDEFTQKKEEVVIESYGGSRKIRIKSGEMNPRISLQT